MILSKEFIKYTGRVDSTNNDFIKLAWPNTSMKINFIGDEVSADLESDGEDYFLVVIDGKVHNQCMPVRERKQYSLVNGLELKEHSLELIKITEAFIGTTTFYGFNILNGTILDKSKDNDLKIEIIGDSISCGFGNLAASEKVEFNAIYNNSYYAYGAIAARKLNADLNITAWSGCGIVKNYDNTGEPMSERFHWITANNTSIKWDFKKYIPNIIVINLGTNDLNKDCKVPTTREEYITEYKKLIDKIILYYNNAKIICAVGSIVDGEDLINLRSWIKDEIIPSYNENGYKDMYYLEFEHQKQENGYGVSYHPSLKTHEIMSEKLVNKIKEIIK